VFALLLAGFTHVAALSLVPLTATLVNKLTGTVLQIVGGLLVLHSVNGNLGLFRRQSLASALVTWLREFPSGKNQTVVLGGVGMAGEVGVAGSLSIGSAKPANLEDRVAHLESQLIEERKRLRELEAAMSKGLASIRSDLSSSISTVDASVRDLATKVESAAVGGIKQQLFGVLLAIYGAVVSVFA